MSRTRISAELRQRVMENGRFRCGYCLTSQHIIGPLLEIDHYVPEAQDGPSTEDNLCVACPMCNSHKADRISATDPETATVQPLYNPKNDRWSEHFTWIEDGTVMQGSTPIGRATVAALQVNHPDVVDARRCGSVLVGTRRTTEHTAFRLARSRSCREPQWANCYEQDDDVEERVRGCARSNRPGAVEDEPGEQAGQHRAAHRFGLRIVYPGRQTPDHNPPAKKEAASESR